MTSIGLTEAAGASGASGASAPVALSWDGEARAHAYRSAQAMAARDPEAAAVLLVQLAGAAPLETPARASRDQSMPAMHEVRPPEGYNATRLFALVAEKGWSWRDYQECHFVAFFALLREWSLLAEEREREAERRMAEARRGAGTIAGGGMSSGAGVGVGASLEGEIAAALAGAARPAGLPGSGNTSSMSSMSSMSST